MRGLLDLNKREKVMDAIQAMLYLIIVMPLIVVTAIVCGLILGIVIYVSIVMTLMQEVFILLKRWVDDLFLGRRPAQTAIKPDEDDDNECC